MATDEGAEQAKAAEEEVIRLAPLKDTLRELYLKSGNRCHFPCCRAVMIDADGDFIGQIVHIEAAEKLGERFNPKMTNEQRRHFSNLMLMCYPHHVKTNDVVTYAVEALQKMKAEHEAKFTDIAQVIENSVTDHGLKTIPGKMVSLAKIGDVLAWPKDAEEISSNLKDLRLLAGRLHKLPPKTRQILSVIANRLVRYSRKGDPGYYHYDHDILFKEISEATHLAVRELIEHVEILRKYHLAETVQTDEDDRPRVLMIKLIEDDRSGWLLSELKEFCRRTKVPLPALIEELKFDMLDKS